MARFPEAQWRPLAGNWALQPKMSRFDLVILHTMAGTLAGTESWFKGDGYGGAESHFGVGPAGEIYQWQDTAFRAEANGAANVRAISIETADRGGGFPNWNLNDGNATPAWTTKQVEAIAKIIVWANRTHNIPIVTIPDSKPSRRGVGFHRQGVPGFVVSGGELWSSARGKTCPGPRRIAQVPHVVARARELSGNTTSAPVKAPISSGGENVLENHRVEGTGNIRLIFPVGATSGILAKGWISAAVDGDSGGTAHVFFQNDAGGLSELKWQIGFRGGHSSRPWAAIPDGTTMVNVNYAFPNGGVITLEGLAK